MSAWIIAKAMAKRGWPSLDECMAVIRGRWRAAAVTAAIQDLMGVAARSRPLSVSRTKSSLTRRYTKPAVTASRIA